MNATNKRATSKGIFVDPGTIAPSVDRDWRNDLILELRLLDVPGDRIGDALMTVEAHITESRESAPEAFGDARAYARDLTSGAEPQRWPVTPAVIAGAVVGVLSMLAITRAFSAWLAGGPVQVVLGDAVSLGVLVLLMLATIAMFTQVLRFVADHPWLTFAISFVGLGAIFAVPALLLRHPLLEAPSLTVGLVGLGLLAVSSMLIVVQTAQHDEITAPGHSPSRTNGSLAAAMILPVVTLGMLLITWIPWLFT